MKNHHKFPKKKYNEISEVSFNHFQSQMQLSPESHLAWRLQTHWLHSRCPSPALQRCTCRTPWTAQTTLRQLLHCQSTTTSTHHQSVTLQRFAASAFYLCSFHLSAWGFFCFPRWALGLVRTLCTNVAKLRAMKTCLPCTASPCHVASTPTQVTLHVALGTSLSFSNGSTDPNLCIFIPFPLIIRIFFPGILKVVVTVLTFLIVAPPLLGGFSTF